MKRIVLALLCLCVAVGAQAKNENKPVKQKAMPPGLQKKLERTGELPPGWQKKLIQGEVLDSELYEYGRKQPVDIEDLPIKPSAGTEILRIEDRIIRIKKDTREILDILGIGV